MEEPNKNYSWMLHLAIVAAMYGYYLYLWYGYLFYDGKAGWKGFEIFTMTMMTAPFYLLFHIIAFFISRHNGLKRIRQ